MNFLTKALGFFLIIFSFAFYQASPMQRGYGHGHAPKRHHYHGSYRPYYRPVVYHRAPRHHKRYYYEPVRYRYYSHRAPRVYHSRPVIIVKL